jgi:hypothetical protein
METPQNRIASPRSATPNPIISVVIVGSANVTITKRNGIGV